MQPTNQLTLLESQLRVLRALQNNKVTFLVIGGQAIAAYLPTRTTQDLDILLSRSNSNAKKATHALQANGWRSPAGLPLHHYLTQKNKKIEYPNCKELKEVDLLSSIDGVNFKEIFQRSKIATFNNLNVRIPSVKDLIQMKQISVNFNTHHVKKNQDLQDIADLTSLLE